MYWKGRGGVWVRIRVFFFFLVSCVLVCVSVLFPRIEPVGKPYREVCLRSELWPWMAHQPNSWSKHPGTRIEQVLAYCRDEQKYVGCIELLFCLTVTMTFGVQTWNFIGLMDEIVPIYPPSFTEIRSKIREKLAYNIFSKVVSSWPWPLIYVPEIYIKSSPCQGLSTS